VTDNTGPSSSDHSEPMPRRVDQSVSVQRDAFTAGRDLVVQMSVPEQARRRRDLPRDVPDFTGRQAELRRLTSFLGRGEADRKGVLISAIDGMAGIGKTALAVHAAHRLTTKFPDGQLFLDLHGFAENLAPTDPSDALDALLRALGIVEPIPPTVEERAALYRNTLADRRILVVLDNAASNAQVRPLLPGAPGCAVLITSRRHLSGVEGTIGVSLDTLPPREARTLFARVAGADRVAGQAADVAEVVELCGRLPLAIRIAAVRLGSRVQWTVADLAARLRDERRRLAVLAFDDLSVAAAFTVSYQHLDPPVQRTFRLLGLHPGPDFDVYAAAALTGSSADEAEHFLDMLLDMHLVEQRLPARYRFHDLLRWHAREMATGAEPEDHQRMAVIRLLDYYLSSTARAADVLDPDARLPVLSIAHPPADRPIIETYRQALNWLEAERADLVVAVRLAAEFGLHTHAWQLPLVLYRYFLLRGYIDDWIETHQLALTAARHDAKPAVEAGLLTHLGVAYRRLGRYHDAVDVQVQALDRYREIRDTPGEIVTLTNLGIAFRRLGRYADAVSNALQALDLHEREGDRRGESHTVTNLGIVYERLGEYDEALNCHHKALALAKELHDRCSEAMTLTNMGIVYEKLGRYDEAYDHHKRALAAARDIGDRHAEGHTLNNVAIIYRRLGKFAMALDHHELALTLLAETGSRGDECEALNDLGETLRAADRRAAAFEHLERAHSLALQIGDRYLEARALDGMARTLQAADPGRACHCWRQALRIFLELGTPESTAVQRLLAAVDAP